MLAGDAWGIGVSAAQHTPGPWKAFTKNGNHVQADKWSIDHEEGGSFTYAPVKAGDKVIAFVVSRSRQMFGVRDITANCRLIAAAPEMLAMLQKLNVEGEVPVGDLLRLLAKATGD